LKYYAGGGEDYPMQVYHYFTDGHMALLAAFVLVALFSALRSAAKRRPVAMFVPLLFSVEMFIVYWKDLPYLYQEGRYLMPVLAFVILAATDGAAILSDAIGRYLPRLGRAARGEALILLILMLPAIQLALAGWKVRSQYAESCDYISNRQVTTAMWIRDNLPDGARIATHDVGAIAYYSGKQIVDMVGLISPEMISRIGSLDGLIGFMNSMHVTHLALLRNWFEVDNQNPLFSTDPNNPEIMEVFDYNPKNVHFLTRDVDQLFRAGQYYASIKDFNTAIKYFAQGIQRDPRSSKGHRLLAEAYVRMGKNDEAAKEFQVTLQLHPGDAGARAGLARVTTEQPRRPSP
jgi:tetratricopeptide (TPR) repeat protein